MKKFKGTKRKVEMKKLQDKDGFDYVIIDYKTAGMFSENINSKTRYFKTDILYDMISFIMKMNKCSEFDANFIIYAKILSLYSQPIDSSLLFKFKDCSSQFMIISNNVIYKIKL